MSRLAPYGRVLACIGLMLLALAPFLLLALLSRFRTGRDLSVHFFAASALLFCVDACLVLLGLRWRRLAWAAGGIMGLVFLLMCVQVGGGKMCWIGSQEVMLVVTVRDAETRRPLPNASVRLFNASIPTEASGARTDESGTAVLQHIITTVGTTSPVQRTGCYDLWRETLQVDAEGYQSIREPLTKYTGPAWDLYGRPLPEVEVSLKRQRNHLTPDEGVMAMTDRRR